MKRVGLLAVLGLSVGSRTAGASDTCPDLIVLVPQLNTALEQAMMDEAKAIATEAVQALECQSEPVDALMITSVLQLAGVTHFFANDLNVAQNYFAWSAAVSPSMNLDAMYGASAVAAYDGARQQVIAGGEASVHVHGSTEAWVDGRGQPSGTPVSFTVGTHLIQHRVDGTLVSEVVTLTRDAVHHVGEVEPAAPAAVADRSRSRTGGNDGGVLSGQTLLYAGGGLAATGAVLMILASSAHKDFDNETDPAKLEGLQAKTNAFGTAGIGLGLAGVGLIGLSVTNLGADGATVGIRGRW